YLGDVYLNGKKVASTDYGYVSFEADITQELNYDKPNVLAVWSGTGPEKGSRWYTGGGLFRDVYLKLQNPTHIARHGVFIHTPEVSKNSATVQVQVEVDGWQKNDVKVYTTVYDPQGKLVGRAEAGMPQHTRQSRLEVLFPEISFPTPQLWSPESPHLYQADVVVKAGEITVDSLRETFGVRWLEFSPEFGMKLNGEKYWVQGCANHHDMGALGAASYDDAIERMMLQLKAFGFNTIRCSHNPYSRSFTRIADRVGMLVVDELVDKWSDKSYWGGRDKFTNIWHRLIPEWIKRTRNCPSVIMWCLGNELQIRNDWAGFPETNDWGVTSYHIMDVLVKRFDPTRKTTVAQYPARAGYINKNDKDFMSYRVAPELARATEIASLNYQSAVYKDYLENDPDMIIFQSEAESYELLQPFYNMPRERTVGIAYWGAIEYWGESNGWPKKGWNYSFFRHTLEPLPQAYLIKSAYLPDEPVVHIGVIDGQDDTVDWNDVQVGKMNLSENWNRQPGSRANLYTFTNAEEVELVYNGKSLGVKKNEVDNQKKRNMILWQDIDYGRGGTLVAIARSGGKETARHQIQTTGKAAALRIKTEDNPSNPTFKADGMSLKYLIVEAVDAKGRLAPTDTTAVSVQVEGAANFLAMDNGDHYTDELFTSDITTKQLYNGKMQVILRSKKGEEGKVTVKATAPGLKSASMKLQTQKVLPE
ncbi:DUF4982 domain-containing protein, partial [Bacteroidales bacterium OttesenSCG-928-L03]|nr:DUF4982 domain-containing protein [Bacteroidales bacterium OttesenSCG-928-L03]